MAQQRKTTAKQPQDGYARQTKALTSQVQRLRGWLGSDPSRLPEFTDGLITLSGHRLLGHRYLAAGADAQESVKRAAELLLVGGPIGPYTQSSDAVRCGVAFVQLATVQVGLGLPAAAGRTLRSWEQLYAQLEPHRLDLRLPPMTAVWGLLGVSRAALDAGETGRADAVAGVAAAVFDAAGLHDDPDAAYLSLDVDRTRADTRWATGHAEESLGLLHTARDRYDAVADGRLDQPGRHPVPLLERLSEPLAGLYRDLADRLRGCDEVDLGLVTRRRLVDLLRGLAARLDDPVPAQLVGALTDLADDLLAAGRVDEAVAIAGEAVGLAEDRTSAGAPRLLAGAVWARVLARAGETDDAVAVLDSLLAGESGSAPAAEDVVRAARAVVLGGPEAHLGELTQAARGVVRRGPVARQQEPVDEVSLAAYAALAVPVTESAAPAVDDTDDWLRRERERAHREEQERLAKARREADERHRAEEAAAVAEAAREADRRAAAAEAGRRLAAEHEAAEEAERQERRRRREERLREHQADADRRAAEEREARRHQLEDRIAALLDDAVGASSPELERLRLELVELPPAEPDQPPAEPDQPAAEPVEPPAELVEAPRALPVEAVPEPEPAVGLESIEEIEVPLERIPEREVPVEVVPVQQVPLTEVPGSPESDEPEPDEPEPDKPEPDEPEPDEPEPDEPEPDEVERARQSWQDLRSTGERKAARGELERLVQLLRDRTEADFAGWATQLQTALDDLASARLRGGDLFGSRAASKESKAVARRIGVG